MAKDSERHFLFVRATPTGKSTVSRCKSGFKSTTLHDTFVNMAWIWMLTNDFDVEWVEMDPLWKWIHIVEFVEWKPTSSNNGN
jgi:hypothetical protein